MTIQSAASQEMRGQLTYTKLILKGVFSISKLLLTSARQVMQLRQTQPSDEHYTRPPRRYDLPSHTPEMKTTLSRKRFLRPTRYCDCRAPEIVALAHELGAFQKSDLEFARAAFTFAKENTTLEIRPILPVEETLRLGTGTCFELIGLFIALCRAAGIPARYKIFSTNMIQSWREATIDADPLAKKWYDSLDNFLFEGEGEAFIDGQWMVAHVGPTAERQAAAGIPVTQFGEDSLGVWFTAKPGTIMHLEALPLGLAAGSRLLHRISPASMERVNISVLKQIERGRQVLAEAGGVEAYDRAVRARAAAAS
jgi:hypothetical protein